MSKTTTIKVEDDLVEALAEEGRKLGGVGWTRMLLIVAKEWADRRKQQDKVA